MLPKVKLIRALQSDFLRRRAERSYDAESMAVSARLLEINPEVFTAWNFRREAIVAGADAVDARARPPLADELTLTEKTLKKNPKSYPSWYHRKWTISRMVDEADAREDVAASDATLARELVLVERLLDADDRNFHCWGYRRFVAALAKVPDADELEFTTKKIEANFSNYSAWHHRSAYLPRVHGRGGGGSLGEGGEEEREKREDETENENDAPPPSSSLPPDVLRAEYELVQNAFFTEPEDQSGWMYHRWLLRNTMSTSTSSAGDDAKSDATAIRETLAREAALCRELRCVIYTGSHTTAFAW